MVELERLSSKSTRLNMTMQTPRWAGGPAISQTACDQIRDEDDSKDRQLDRHQIVEESTRPRTLSFYINTGSSPGSQSIDQPIRGGGP